MIAFHYETNFKLNNETQISEWICNAIKEENFTAGEVNYIFCSDDYLHKINLDFLNHDTLTDVISFDYSENKTISGDIYISVDRVKENTIIFSTAFNQELARVIIHGALHFCGYKDKTKHQIQQMRSKEDYYLSKLF